MPHPGEFPVQRAGADPSGRHTPHQRPSPGGDASASRTGCRGPGAGHHHARVLRGVAGVSRGGWWRRIRRGHRAGLAGRLHRARRHAGAVGRVDARRIRFRAARHPRSVRLPSGRDLPPQAHRHSGSRGSRTLSLPRGRARDAADRGVPGPQLGPVPAHRGRSRPGGDGQLRHEGGLPARCRVPGARGRGRGDARQHEARSRL